MYSVGKLSKRFGISRTALLYYDSIGLISPETRSPAGYRMYSQADVDRLEQIMILRNAGMPIKQIHSLITANEETVAFGTLMKRLRELNLEIERLKKNQKQIIDILGNSSIREHFEKNADSFLDDLLRFAEIDPDKKEQWHREFELQAPELHTEFLKALGFHEEEIRDIKARINH